MRPDLIVSELLYELGARYHNFPQIWRGKLLASLFRSIVQQASRKDEESNRVESNREEIKKTVYSPKPKRQEICGDDAVEARDLREIWEVRGVGFLR